MHNIWLKIRPYLGRAKSFIILILERNFPYPVFLKIPQKLPEYAPNSAGNYKELSLLTLRTAKNIFPRINEMVGQSKLPQVISTDHFLKYMDFEELTESIDKFELLFNFYKSDKASNHKYQFIYSPILAAIGNSGNLLEIGMGTNNTQFASNMGKKGTPGASLRAFKELLPNWKIYGADIDREILFNDKEINTFFVDQLDYQTLIDLGARIGQKLDLIIDDGLHSPDANVNVLIFAMTALNKNGWIVIEDINFSALPIWQTVSYLILSEFKVYLIENNGTLVFAAKKIGHKG
jgi:hypothetical protein